MGRGTCASSALLLHAASLPAKWVMPWPYQPAECAVEEITPWDIEQMYNIVTVVSCGRVSALCRLRAALW